MPFDLANKLLTKKVKNRLLKTRGNRTWSLTKVLIQKDLPRRMNYQLDGAVFELISYIDEKSPKMFYAGMPDKEEREVHPIRVYSYVMVRSVNVYKFLINLQIKGIISNLSLPICVEKNKDGLNIALNLVAGDDITVRQAVNSSDDFLKKTIGFDLINKDVFLKIKKNLENKNVKAFNEYRLRKEKGLPPPEMSNPGIVQAQKEKIKSITIITPQYTKFDYYWIVFNHQYENKHMIKMKNKFSGNEYDSNAACLLRLFEEKKIDYNHSFLGYMNTGIFKINPMKKFSQTQLLKVVKSKIILNDSIKFEKESLELLDKDIAGHFSLNK